jgi:methyl-accepting chemotaxis protein
MKKFKQLSFKQKLGLISGTGILFTTMIVIIYGSYASRKKAIEDAQIQLINTATSYSDEIEGILENAMLNSLAISQALSIVGEPGYKGHIKREDAQQMARRVLYSNKDFIGFTLAFEPNSFDGLDTKFINAPAHDETGRFLSYITKTTNGGVSIDALIDYHTAEKAPWYFKPKEDMTDYITEPTIYPIQGKDVLMVSCMTPIVDNGTFLGVTGIDYPIDFMQQLVVTKQKENEGYQIAIISNSGVYVANTLDTKLINSKITDQENLSVSNQLAAIQRAQTQLNQEDGNVSVNIPMTVGSSKHPWQLRLSVPVSVITHDANVTMWNQILMGLIFSVIGVSLMIIYVIYAVKPLEAMVVLANDMANGLLNTKVNIRTSDDEIGTLYKAFSRMRSKLSEIIIQIQEGAEQISSASSQLSTTSIQVSQGASEQASATEQVSSTMQEMTSNIIQNKEHAVKAKEITELVTKDVQTSAHSAQESVKAMNEIVTKISFIKGIAGQTNILSLNAAVEAARSGEHGRGFAVVASEVRKLADHTTNASVIIDNLSHSSQETINHTGDLMQQIVPHMTEAMRLIQEITSGSQEQTIGAQQVNNAIQQLNQVTQQNAAASEEMASSSEELASQAENLKHQISYFKV